MGSSKTCTVVSSSIISTAVSSSNQLHGDFPSYQLHSGSAPDEFQKCPTHLSQVSQVSQPLVEGWQLLHFMSIDAPASPAEGNSKEKRAVGVTIMMAPVSSCPRTNFIVVSFSISITVKSSKTFTVVSSNQFHGSVLLNHFHSGVLL